VAAMTWARPRSEIAPRIADAARSAAARAISALVSKIRMSTSVPQRRSPRPHEELQPFLGHEAMVRLLHVDVVETEEVLAAPEEARYLDDREPGRLRGLVLSLELRGVGGVGVVHVVEDVGRDGGRLERVP